MSAAKAAQLLAIGLAAGAGACGPKPFVLDGNADYVRVTYAGDMESATAAAKRHCAQFERVPRFREIEESVAFFFCVRP
jgi:2-C-methyl-D-erythritol 4-phosphate cytidylyltransferase